MDKDLWGLGWEQKIALEIAQNRLKKLLSAEFSNFKSSLLFWGCLESSWMFPDFRILLCTIYLELLVSSFLSQESPTIFVYIFVGSKLKKKF